MSIAKAAINHKSQSSDTKRRMAPMNAPYDFSRLESFDFRRHYEKLAMQSVGSVLRHRRMIAKIVVGTVLAAALLVSVLPRQYTAEALVQPQLFTQTGEPGSTTALASIDGASLVASEATLIQSPGVARSVAQTLKLDQQPQFARSRSYVGRAFGALRSAILPETVLASPIERATQNLRKTLNVTRDTRSYLITIGFTSANPEKAAQIANAFALEYVNKKILQSLSEQVATAKRDLARASAIYGERHPALLRAVDALDQARERLQAATNAPIGIELAPAEGVNLAEPSSAPSSPNGTAILGLAFLFSLVTGIFLAVRKDHKVGPTAISARK